MAEGVKVGDSPEVKVGVMVGVGVRVEVGVGETMSTQAMFEVSQLLWATLLT